MLLDEALATWPQWQPRIEAAPHVLTKFSQGKTNQSWLLGTQHGKVVLRLSHPNESWLGIDRNREAQILASLTDSSFSPSVLYSNHVSGILVTEFIEGEVHSGGSLSDRLSDSLASLIRDYQRLTVDLPKFDYHHYLQSYFDRVVQTSGVSSKLEKDWQRFQPELLEFQEKPWKPVLVHHDLQGENLIVSSRQLCLIDWEYAANGHPGFDWVSTGCLDFPGANPEEVETLQNIIRWLDLLWHLLRAEHH